MKVHMNIANGYKRGEIKNLFEANPDTLTDPEARIGELTRWADTRYGNWLRTNEIADFQIYDVAEDAFRIEFTHDTDAQAFVAKVGGTLIGE